MNDIETRTWTIHESNFAALNEKIEKLNRRLERNDIAERFAYEIVGTETKEREDGIVDVYRKIVFHQPEIGYADKKLLGTVQIEEGGTVLRMVPGMETPAGFERPDAHRCDHCNVDRLRTKSYLILDTETGEIVQVGSTCISLYLGIEVRGLWALESFTAEELAEMEEADEGYRASEGGPWSPTRYSVHYLIRLGYAVSNGGRKFVSRAKAREWEKSATVDDVLNVIHFRPRRNTEPEIIAWVNRMKEEAAALPQERVDEIAEFGRNLGDSDYGQNLRVILDSSSTTYKGAGLAVSAVGAWFRATQKREEAAQRVNEWVGKEKERLRNLHLEVAVIREFEDMYGTKSLIVFRDAEGRAMKWWASGAKPDLEVGTKVVLTGTVKGHETYEGTKQTNLTRCAYSVVE